MVSNLEQKFSQSRTKMRNIQDDLTTRVTSLRDDLWRKQQIATGKLRDESLQTAYGIKGSVVGQAADLLQQIPSLDQPAKQLRSIADEARAAEAAVAKPPIKKYDELNVNEVSEALEGLDVWSLQKVREYETANKNRVTVLRAVTTLLEG
jgi:uncharacterized protein YukE